MAVVCDQVAVGELALGLPDDLGHAVHPVAFGAGLVADLEEHVLQIIHLRDDLPHHRLLVLEQVAALEAVDLLAVPVAHAVDVVPNVERREVPLVVVVPVAEERQLDDHAALPGLGDELAEAFEVRVVPLVQVELVPAVGVAGGRAAGPGREQSPPGRVERVERLAPGLAVDAREGAGVIQPCGLELVEIGPEVEVAVEHGAVMLGGGDQDRRLAAEDDVMRVLGMELQRLRAPRARDEARRQEPSQEGCRDDRTRVQGDAPFHVAFFLPAHRPARPPGSPLMPGPRRRRSHPSADRARMLRARSAGRGRRRRRTAPSRCAFPRRRPPRRGWSCP